jgi:hypothetical protein
MTTGTQNITQTAPVTPASTFDPAGTPIEFLEGWHNESETRSHLYDNHRRARGTITETANGWSCTTYTAPIATSTQADRDAAMTWVEDTIYVLTGEWVGQE